MVNSHRSVSAISAAWTKAGLSLILFCLSLLLHGQQELTELSDKERHKFNEIFFQAQKEKMLGNPEEALELYRELYKITAFNPTVCYELAQLYSRMGEQDDALFFAERATELEPGNKWYQLLLANVYREFGMPAKEVEVVKKLVQLDSLNPDYRFELAMAYYQNEEYDQAIQTLNELEAIIGINEELSRQKKTIYLEAGELQSAVDEMEKLIRAFPKNMDYRGTLAQIYDVNGMPEKAFEVYQQMLAVAPEEPRPHLDLARYYQQQGEAGQSMYHLEKAVNSPDLSIDKKVPILLSMFEASSVDTALQRKAYGMLETVMAQNPEDPKAYAIYGDFLSKDGRNKEALQAYKNAVQLEGGNRFKIWEQILLIEIQNEMFDSLAVDAPRAIELFPNQPLPYFFAGVAANYQKEYFDAIGYLEDGLNYVLGAPRMKEQFYTQLAEAYYRMGEFEQSDSYFDKALALNARNASTLNNYAYYLSVRGDRLDKALEMTSKSNELQPDNPVFLDTWAWVLYQRGEYSKALEKMEKLLQLEEPQSGEVLEHYGDILYRDGQHEAALEQWKKARELGETSAEIDQKIKSGRIAD